MMERDDSRTDRRPPPDSNSPLSDFLLIERINQCPKLASLKSINETLHDLLDSDDSFVGQIAEVIRLDPSLTTRVLDLVNSIFFGSKDEKRISGVEEASAAFIRTTGTPKLLTMSEPCSKLLPSAASVAKPS